MRTYYIHGKIKPTGFHMTATLLKIPPKGYYIIGEQIADSRYQAIRMTVEQCSLHPPMGREVKIDLSTQSSFLNVQK